MGQKQRHLQNWYFVKRSLIQHIFCSRTLSFRVGRRNYRLADGLARSRDHHADFPGPPSGGGVAPRPPTGERPHNGALDGAPRTDAAHARGSNAPSAATGARAEHRPSLAHSKRLDTCFTRLLAKFRSRNEDKSYV